MMAPDALRLRQRDRHESKILETDARCLEDRCFHRVLFSLSDQYKAWMALHTLEASLPVELSVQTTVDKLCLEVGA